jgi:hypothetical protein
LYKEYGSENADLISDWDATDGIVLDAVVFTGLSTNVVDFDPARFKSLQGGYVTDEAADPGSWVLYEEVSGDMYYDSDGSNGSNGFSDAQLVATLESSAGDPPELDSGDIELLA